MQPILFFRREWSEPPGRPRGLQANQEVAAFMFVVFLFGAAFSVAFCTLSLDTAAAQARPNRVLLFASFRS